MAECLDRTPFAWIDGLCSDLPDWPACNTADLVEWVPSRRCLGTSSAYSSSTGFQEESGLNRSMFLNSLSVIGPKSFS